MANYYAAARTNYFNVKDADAFLAAMKPILGINVSQEENGSFLILCNHRSGGWDNWIYDEETDTDEEIDLPAIVAEHLVDDSVAIFMESGAEKMRYIVGQAEAINNKGERVSIGLDNIYVLAEKLTSKPGEISRAEY